MSLFLSEGVKGFSEDGITRCEMLLHNFVDVPRFTRDKRENVSVHIVHFSLYVHSSSCPKFVWTTTLRFFPFLSLREFKRFLPSLQLLKTLFTSWLIVVHRVRESHHTWLVLQNSFRACFAENGDTKSLKKGSVDMVASPSLTVTVTRW